MIDFMILALPRSGTTWAANWLTTDSTLCLHDPLYLHHYSELDGIASKKRLGVSCTGLYNFPAWVNAHPAKKVILHRDTAEINASLSQLKLAEISEKDQEKLNNIAGLHLKWTSLFEQPELIYEYLLGRPFDAERHAELRKMQIQPEFAELRSNPDVTRRLVAEMKGA